MTLVDPERIRIVQIERFRDSARVHLQDTELIIDGFAPHVLISNLDPKLTDEELGAKAKSALVEMRK